MSDLLIPTLTLSPRGHGSPPTTSAAETVYITDHVTVWSWSTTTATITESVIISSFIHVTTTATTTFTTQSPTTLTSTLTSTTALPTSTTPDTSSSTKPTTSLSLIPTSTPTSTVCTAAHAHKSIDPYQVLTIVFGVLILILLAMMYWLVRRFYKMYRAERVLRKQLQTEGTEMPAMTMGGAGGEGR